MMWHIRKLKMPTIFKDRHVFSLRNSSYMHRLPMWLMELCHRMLVLYVMEQTFTIHLLLSFLYLISWSYLNAYLSNLFSLWFLIGTLMESVTWFVLEHSSIDTLLEHTTTLRANTLRGYRGLTENKIEGRWIFIDEDSHCCSGDSKRIRLRYKYATRLTIYTKR